MDATETPYLLTVTKAGDAEATRKIQFLIPVFDLDTNNDGDLDYPIDGIEFYLPGYLQSTSKIGGAVVPWVQEMKLIANAPAEAAKATFTISGASTWTGFCTNSEVPLGMGDDDDDFSFSEIGELPTVTVNVTDHKAIVPFYCKDYGGHCNVSVLFKEADDTPIGTATTKEVPVDTDNDNVADLYEWEQLALWANQYGLTEPPGGLPFFSHDSDLELIDADGDNNGDEGRNLPDHAGSPGDGLTVFEEYRGYVLDGGANGFSGGHKRLTAFRKELLVEVSEVANIASPDNGANTAARAYTLAKTMGAVADFYNNIDWGAGIDIYWAKDDVVLGPEIDYYDDSMPDRDHAYYYNGELLWPTPTPGGSIQGGAFLTADPVWKSEVAQEVYEDVFGEPGQYNYMANQINRNPRFGSFIKLRMLSRNGQMQNNGSVRMLMSGGALSIFDREPGAEDETLNGAWIHVNTISEEGPFMSFMNGEDYTTVEFDNILQYAVAHEIGHLLIQTQSGTDWPDNYHLDVGWALMSTSHPEQEGLSALVFDDMEIEAINLRLRASVVHPE